MPHKPVQVSITALTRMMATQRLGPPHLAIKAAPVYLNLDQDRDADAAMWAGFAALELVDQRGRLDGDALDMLGLLSRPATEYFAHFTENSQRFSALVAGGGSTGVLAFRAGDIVELRALSQESLPETLLRQLPDSAPATVDSLNVRLADLRDRARADDSPGARDGWGLRRLTEEPIIGQGELYVGIRDYRGEYTSTVDDPIRYEDRASGRVMVTLSRGYLSVAPATKRLLLDRLNEAHRGLTE